MERDAKTVVVLRQQSGAVYSITLNRPERRNAVNAELSRELIHALREADEMEDVRLVVLTGAGDSFSVGGDMSEDRSSLSHFKAQARLSRDILFALMDCEKPIVCRLNGDAIGAGATIALLCDIVVASDGARIGDPHVRMGLVAGDGGVLIWPALAGHAIAKYYLLTGDLLSAEEAKAAGLVAKVVPGETLDGEVDKLARKLSEGAPLALQWTKRSINAHLQSLAKLQFDLSLAYEGLTILSEDHAEAKEAFKAKRKAAFHGD